MTRKLAPFFALATCLGLAGCGSAASRQASASPVGAAGYADGSTEATAEASLPLEDDDAYALNDGAESSSGRREGSRNALGSPSGPPAPPSQEPSPQPQPSPAADRAQAPLLVYQATLTLAVFETQKQLDRIEKQVQEAGGYLVSRSDQEITVRVPADTFNASLESFAQLGDELHRAVSVRDVTAQFRDLEIRLQNARAVRGRLEELLAKVTNVEEALAVERELERLSGEIESMLGQLKLMSELVSFSTITVRFAPHAVDQVRTRLNLPFPWLHELGLPNLLSM